MGRASNKAHELSETLLDKTFEEAKRVCENDSVSFRKVKEDGVDFFITDDLQTNRLNFTIESGIVIEIEIF